MTRRLPLALLVASLGVVPVSARAASPMTIAKDCLDHGRLTRTYSPADLRNAIARLPSDALQYSNCQQVIRRAQLAAAGGGSGRTRSGGGDSGSSGAGGGTAGGGGSGTGGGTPSAAVDPSAPQPADTAAALQAATPQQRAAVTEARTTGAAPISVDGTSVTPSALESGRLEDLNTLPTPVVVTLILLGLGTAAGGGAFAQHVVTRRRRA